MNRPASAPPVQAPPSTPRPRAPQTRQVPKLTPAALPTLGEPPAREEEVFLMEVEPPPPPSFPRRPRRRQRRSRKLLLIAALGGGMLCLLLLGGVVAALLFASSGPPSEIRYLPDDPHFVASVRVNKVLASEEYTRLKAEFPDPNDDPEKEFADKFGFPLHKVTRLTAGGKNAQKESKYQYVVIARTEKAFSAEEIQANMKVAPEVKGRQFRTIDVGKQKIYAETFELTPGNVVTGRVFCLPESNVIVSGWDADILRAILERDKKPELPPAMQNAMGEADYSQTAVLVLNVKALRESGTASRDLSTLHGNEEDLQPLLNSTEGAVVQCSLGATLKTQATLLCTDAKAAEDGKKLLEGGLVRFKQRIKEAPGAPKEFPNLFDAIKINSSGSRIVATMDYSFDSLLTLIKEANKR